MSGAINWGLALVTFLVMGAWAANLYLAILD